ncbi:chorismate-binding protein [Candidatus Microthrix parvicella]|mgnify:FL=1|jgi:para-aminobenzoate synthetase component 1|uniref:Para-aminobenzoate synthase aminase component n=1 Tax=Candidatus Neomicrothrix parvicella RN1 TaxID=1229780 RepID=R4YVV3_9ACTN|nr:anthranilate synthase component I family protein [Candidatus Microthrix parvicella]CCM61943.1 Para-aminobenzoate synthase aminase component [Candidatus Microthrix parvicella RN1]
MEPSQVTDALVGTTWVPPGLDPSGPWALAGGRWHWGTPEVSDDPAVLDGTGTWVVCLPAQGPMVGARFPHSAPAISPPSPDAPPFPAADPSVAWVTSLGRRAHALRVADIRERIADGDVYQVNLTRRLAGPVRQDHPGASALALTSRLAQAHQAPHGATLCLPALGVWVVGASPERFLRREGDLVISEPIKGTAASAELLTAKDRAENVMICDLVRNDLGRVCRPGTVEVPDLLRVEAHPSLVHLVTTVIGRLRPDVSWGELLDATFPPGSVTGAPKLAALKAIDQLEPTGRGPYCGALGWVDADACEADLAVSIRTFWASSDAATNATIDATIDATRTWRWTFGTGGAITWDSNAADEWAETELKAARLIELAQPPLTQTGHPLHRGDTAPQTW